MIDGQLKLLKVSIRKLYQCGALKNIQKIFEKTHTADIASLLDAFAPHERLEIFQLEKNVEKRAEVLSYLSPPTQKEILLTVTSQEAQRLVSHMESDDAADLLRALPDEFSNSILSNMNQEDSEDVVDLLGYPDDTAGGLMSSDFLALSQDLKVSEVIGQIQAGADDNLISFYVYVVNETGHLIGVLSLKQLLLSNPTETLKNVMSTDVISVDLDTDQQDVARVVERYDFLSIPVVDSSNLLMGVITVDDVIDVIRAEGKEDLMAMGRVTSHHLNLLSNLKVRLPWLGIAFLSGLVGYLLIYFFLKNKFLNESALIWHVVAFIPVIFSLGAATGNQSLTVSVGISRLGHLERWELFEHILSELRLSLVFALIFSVFVFVLSYFYIGDFFVVTSITTALTLQIIVSMVLGSSTPFILNRLSFDPALAAVPFFTVFSDLLALLILFSSACVFWSYTV